MFSQNRFLEAKKNTQPHPGLTSYTLGVGAYTWRKHDQTVHLNVSTDSKEPNHYMSRNARNPVFGVSDKV